MKSYNGNIKQSINIGHWNGGSSYLGKSDRGIEKLNEIEHYLISNKLDILGISEANLDIQLDESAYLIQGYNVIRSSGDIARVIVYIKEDLQYKILSSLNNDIAAIWLEVGKYRSKWTVCQYYREHRVLGVQGSESLDSQTRRFETFLSACENYCSIFFEKSLIKGNYVWK